MNTKFKDIVPHRQCLFLYLSLSPLKISISTIFCKHARKSCTMNATELTSIWFLLFINNTEAGVKVSFLKTEKPLWMTIFFFFLQDDKSHEAPFSEGHLKLDFERLSHFPCCFEGMSSEFQTQYQTTERRELFCFWIMYLFLFPEILHFLIQHDFLFLSLQCFTNGPVLD